MAHRAADNDWLMGIRPKRLLVLASLVVACISILTWVADAVKQRIVTPPALAQVSEDVKALKLNLDAQTTSTTRLSGRVGDVEVRLSRIEDLFEIVAIDVCLRRKGDPWATRRMNCNEYLNGD